MDLGLQGKVAIVGGSTSGLGRAAAIALADEGMRVVVTGRRQDVAEALAASLPTGVAVAGDLDEPGFARRLIDATVSAFGEPDVVVLNGPGPAPGPATGLTADALRSGLRSLLLGHHELLGFVVPHMRARGWGRVIAIGSSGVVTPLPELAVSNIGRAALAAYLKTLAAEVAADGVTVNMVVPGRIQTPRVDQVDEVRARRTGLSAGQVKATSVAGIPARRYGTTREVGAVVAFLAGVPASYVTGTAVRCDGGLVATL